MAVSRGIPQVIRPWLLIALRLCVGGVFIYAGTVKVIDPERFLVDVQAYHLLSYRLAVLVAVYLPWLEIVGGICFVLRRIDRGAKFLLFILTTVFLIAITQAWVRGLDLSCGCFSSSGVAAADYMWLLTRDVLLLSGICIVSMAGRVAERQFSFETSKSRTP